MRFLLGHTLSLSPTPVRLQHANVGFLKKKTLIVFGFFSSPPLITGFKVAEDFATRGEHSMA